MGQRANLIIMENNSYTLYYDHWAANSLDSYLFWGPERAVNYFRDHEKSGEEYWLDTTWCEGGAVIDLDLKVLLFFGGEDILYDVCLREKYLQLLSHQWPGYLIKWAHRGVIDLAEYVGYKERDSLLNEPGHFGESSRSDFFQASGRELPEGVLSIENGDKLAIYPCYGYDADECILSAGESIIMESRKISGATSFIFPDLSTIENSDFARFGIHLNVDRKELFYWMADPHSFLKTKLQEFWPEWTIEGFGFSYKKHEELTQYKLMFGKAEEEQLTSLIRKIVCRPYREDDNFVDAFVLRLSEEGKDVEVNPLIHSTDLFDMPTVIREQIFDGIAAKSK